MRLPELGRKVLLIALVATLAPHALNAEVQRTPVTVFEDWPADSTIDMGTISCPGGEIVWMNPVTPVCPGSGQFHFRRVVGYACYSAIAGGSPEPRLSGVGLFVANGNLDADYSGPVWGTWLMVPSQGCDPEELVDPPVFWTGAWQGRRSKFCDGGPCLWIGDLKMAGKGHGGAIDGIHIKATAVLTTFTPVPLPWELIPGFPFTGPEGVMTATIKE